jgi:hypothetical protein
MKILPLPSARVSGAASESVSAFYQFDPDSDSDTDADSLWQRLFSKQQIAHIQHNMK